MHKPDMAGRDGRISIGWLHRDFPYSQGTVPPDFLVRIKEFSQKCGASIDALGLGACGGYYACQFCNNYAGTGMFGVLARDRVYFSPQMIAHFIEEHNYALPDEFIRAVMACPLPGTREYELAAQPFRLERPKKSR